MELPINETTSPVAFVSAGSRDTSARKAQHNTPSLSLSSRSSLLAASLGLPLLVVHAALAILSRGLLL